MESPSTIPGITALPPLPLSFAQATTFPMMRVE
ncbi:hypothetical protein COLO4_01276 [Corchorus olitorius]|uniref:Uncharacterized protein n=1 Tax=Corchorus olitorius TaxID=93759 RepID=A0A1R3L2Q6_9ROSI|nr:hypothetical protein COLO4_01276 [Corchorus olitorius]